MPRPKNVDRLSQPRGWQGQRLLVDVMQPQPQWPGSPGYPMQPMNVVRMQTVQNIQQMPMQPWQCQVPFQHIQPDMQTGGTGMAMMHMPSPGLMMPPQYQQPMIGPMMMSPHYQNQQPMMPQMPLQQPQQQPSVAWAEPLPAATSSTEERTAMPDESVKRLRDYDDSDEPTTKRGRYTMEYLPAHLRLGNLAAHGIKGCVKLAIRKAVLQSIDADYNPIRLQRLGETDIDMLLFVYTGVLGDMRLSELFGTGKKILIDKVVDTLVVESQRIKRSNPQRLARLTPDLSNLEALALELGFPKEYLEGQDATVRRQPLAALERMPRQEIWEPQQQEQQEQQNQQRIAEAGAAKAAAASAIAG